MNIFKLISIILISIICINSLFAQEKREDSVKVSKPAQQDSNIISKKKDNIDSLNHCINKHENLIKTKTVDQQVESLPQIIEKKDTIIKNPNDSSKIKNETIISKDAELKMFRFFKIQDSSIFNKHFVNFKLEEIPLCLQNHYKIILDVWELDSLLSFIGNKIKKIETGEDYKNLSTKLKQEILESAIKKYLDKAGSLIMKIDEKDIDGLYPDQRSYYRPLLIKKYNGFIDKIYTDE